MLYNQELKGFYGLCLNRLKVFIQQCEVLGRERKTFMSQCIVQKSKNIQQVLKSSTLRQTTKAIGRKSSFRRAFIQTSTCWGCPFKCVGQKREQQRKLSLETKRQLSIEISRTDGDALYNGP